MLGKVSGALVDTTVYEVPYEETVAAAVGSYVELVGSVVVGYCAG